MSNNHIVRYEILFMRFQIREVATARNKVAITRYKVTSQQKLRLLEIVTIVQLLLHVYFLYSNIDNKHFWIFVIPNKMYVLCLVLKTTCCCLSQTLIRQSGFGAVNWNSIISF